MAVLVKATWARLTAVPEIWGNRIYKAQLLQSDEKPAVFPYVVCSLAGGGNEPERPRKRVYNLLWQVRAISDQQEEAYAAALRLGEILSDADIRSTHPLDQGHESWVISSVTEEDTLDVVKVDESEMLYHVGAVWRVMILEK
jgi:hypothetical protein